MTHRLLLVTALATACSPSPETEVQAAAPPDFDPHAVAVAADPAPVLPRSKQSWGRARSGEPEMLRAPVDWRAEPRGLPRNLAERLAAIDAKRRHALEEGYPKTSRLYSLPVPDQEQLWCHWYLSSNAQVMGDTFHVFLEDRSTGSMTERPVVHTSGWLSYPPPEPRFIDLDGDGRRELHLKDLHHNGTWNVHQDAWFELGEDLSLTCVLALVTDENELLPEGAQLSRDKLRDVERELSHTAEGALVVDVWVRGTTAGSPREDLGRLWLERAQGAERWTVAERLVSDPGGAWEPQVALHGGWAWGWLEPTGPRPDGE